MSELPLRRAGLPFRFLTSMHTHPPLPSSLPPSLPGIPPHPYELNAGDLLMSRLKIGGSMIGGIKETQEMLEFCGRHGIVSMIEKVPVSYANKAMARLEKNDVKFRFVCKYPWKAFLPSLPPFLPPSPPPLLFLSPRAYETLTSLFIPLPPSVPSFLLIHSGHRRDPQHDFARGGEGLKRAVGENRVRER